MFIPEILNRLVNFLVFSCLVHTNPFMSTSRIILCKIDYCKPTSQHILVYIPSSEKTSKTESCMGYFYWVSFRLSPRMKEQLSQSSILYLITCSRHNLARLNPYYSCPIDICWKIIGSGYPYSFPQSHI